MTKCSILLVLAAATAAGGCPTAIVERSSERRAVERGTPSSVREDGARVPTGVERVETPVARCAPDIRELISVVKSEPAPAGWLDHSMIPSIEACWVRDGREIAVLRFDDHSAVPLFARSVSFRLSRPMDEAWTRESAGRALGRLNIPEGLSWEDAEDALRAALRVEGLSAALESGDSAFLERAASHGVFAAPEDAEVLVYYEPQLGRFVLIFLCRHGDEFATCLVDERDLRKEMVFD